MSSNFDESKITTADQLAWLEREDARFELVRGELKMMMSPAGGRHGRVAMNVARILANHVASHQLGVVFAAETGFILAKDPDTVRAPDVAFVANERLRELHDDTGFVPFAPDLAVEVISPRDGFSSVEEKAFAWLEAGTRLVLLVDPANRRIHDYRPPRRVTVLREEDELDADEVVSGWRVDIREFFR